MKTITRKEKRKSNLLLREIKVDKTIIQNPLDIAKEFNNFLTFVGPKFAKKISSTEKTFQEFLTRDNKKM